jgi:hypothetical protein
VPFVPTHSRFTPERSDWIVRDCNFESDRTAILNLIDAARKFGNRTIGLRLPRWRDTKMVRERAGAFGRPPKYD